MNVLYERDVKRDVLDGKRIAIIGYGAQGRPQALNLRDSGLDVVIGLRPQSASRATAEADELPVADVPDAVGASDVVMMLLPDEVQGQVYANDIAPHLRDGAYVGFAHGFAIHYGQVVPAKSINVFLAAPKGVGRMVRREYEAGRGVPCLVGVHQDATGATREVALAYASGLGCGRVGIFETTFREETETDLFSEQTILCGGMIELIRQGFETLVDAGYAPEVAYFECLHEVKLIADLVHERGIAEMREAISNTAAYGGVSRGSRVVGTASRAAMEAVLREIRSGAFAKEWIAEHDRGCPRLTSAIEAERVHAIEGVGSRLRALMARSSGAEGPEPN